jgi:hypothetical protein
MEPLVNLVQKQLPLALAAMLLKTRLRCQRLLNPRHPLHAYSSFKHHADCRLVQRFLAVFRTANLHFCEIKPVFG